MTRTEAPATAEESSIVAKLSTLDRFLAVWILVAMAVGLGLGRLVPGMDDALAHLEIGGISLPIALGLLIMMYPVLAKVRYDRLDAVTGDKRLMVSSLVVNWLIGPAVMFALAWIFLPDLPEYRTGLIIVGLARCIAMVIIWNDLACGDREAAAVLVALNSVFQVLAFGLLGWFYLDLLPGWLGLGDGESLDISMWKIALNVVIFLGVPLLAGFLTRRTSRRPCDTAVDVVVAGGGRAGLAAGPRGSDATRGTRAVGEPRPHPLGYGDRTGPASATLTGVGRPGRDAVRALTGRLGRDGRRRPGSG
ncbi:hypothetical protein ABZS79_01145 [Streptomyces griseoloalbus]|uniref:arsenic resistance protein n=1 Tax=Streptomyces griseoloalbus TaxID=67303 RepID=UPI0033B54F99